MKCHCAEIEQVRDGRNRWQGEAGFWKRRAEAAEAQLDAKMADAWDEGWRAAQEVVESDLREVEADARNLRAEVERLRKVEEGIRALADRWEQQDRDRMILSVDGISQRLRELRAVVTEDPCRHCGQGPDADGDHSCPCPYSDADCPNHPAFLSPSPAATTGEAHQHVYLDSVADLDHRTCWCGARE